VSCFSIFFCTLSVLILEYNVFLNWKEYLFLPDYRFFGLHWTERRESATHSAWDDREMNEWLSRQGRECKYRRWSKEYKDKGEERKGRMETRDALIYTWTCMKGCNRWSVSIPSFLSHFLANVYSHVQGMTGSDILTLPPSHCKPRIQCKDDWRITGTSSTRPAEKEQKERGHTQHNAMQFTSTSDRLVSLKKSFLRILNF